MKVINIVPLLIIFLLIGGCGSQLPAKTYYVAKREAAKSRPAYKQFQALCDSEDSSFINKPVEVEGYLFADSSFGNNCNGDGWGPLFKWGYKYQECSTGSFSDYKSVVNGQLFRFYIGKKDESACVGVKRIIDLYVSQLDSDQCLAKQEIELPKSKYAKVLEFGYIDSENNHVLGKSNEKIKEDLISFHGYSIIEIETGKTYAVASRTYTYTPEPGNRVIGGFHCDVKNVVKLNEIIIPN